MMRKRCHFVIVDDDPNAIFLMTHSLQRVFPDGLIATFENGLDALAHIVRNRTDLLITDHSMPNITGSGLVQELRKRGIGIPVIMVSNSPNAREAAAEVGVNRFVGKGEALTQVPELMRELIPACAL